jgi:hypothetical protein
VQGPDVVNVLSTFGPDHNGLRTTTILNTMAGDDRVNVSLAAGTCNI